jgi:hypothetical protein
MARGELRRLMAEALQTAGPEGIEVRSLATQLQINPVNIHSWFHSALRKHPQIRKLAPGRYVLDGTSELLLSNPLASTSASLTRSPRIPRTRGSLPKRSRRGEMTRQIVQLLTAAGDQGISVPQIASRIGSHYRNVHVWLCSTGRENYPIERVARGIYRLRPTSPALPDHLPA